VIGIVVDLESVFWPEYKAAPLGFDSSTALKKAESLRDSKVTLKC
jgi:hypothetical protein